MIGLLALSVLLFIILFFVCDNAEEYFERGSFAQVEAIP